MLNLAILEIKTILFHSWYIFFFFWGPFFWLYQNILFYNIVNNIISYWEHRLQMMYCQNFSEMQEYGGGELPPAYFVLQKAQPFKG